MAIKPALLKITDEELVVKITRSKNVMLFEIIYDRYAKTVFNKCLGFSKSVSEAEDLTQDVFLLLFVKLGSFKGRSKFSSWVYAFTYNFCVNYVNRNKGRKISDQSYSISNNPERLLDKLDEVSLFEMRSEKLKKALQYCAPEDKTILLLKYQDDVSIKELTRLMNIGESAVKMRLKRAKARIIEIYNNLP